MRKLKKLLDAVTSSSQYNSRSLQGDWPVKVINPSEALTQRWVIFYVEKLVLIQ